MSETKLTCNFSSLTVGFFFFFLGICLNSFGQIEGPTNSRPNLEERYTVSSTQFSSGSLITWDVTNGTIISQNTDPTNDDLFCVVRWNANAISGGVTFLEEITETFYKLKINLRQTSTNENCPQANAGLDKTICLGTSTQIGTPGQSGVLYSWTPVTGLNNSFIDQPIASPSATTTYTLVTLSQTANLIQNSDFEGGLNNFSTDYGIYPNGDNLCPNPNWPTVGSILIASNPYVANGNWCNNTLQNHSPSGNKMLIVDGSCGSNRRIWYRTVSVNPSTIYYFNAWAASVADDLNGATTPNLRVRINGTNIIQNFLVPWQNCASWNQLSGTWNSGTATSAVIEIYDDGQYTNGNDFALDDIYFSACPTTTSQVTVYVVNSPSPTISPAGPVTVCYQYESSANTLLTSNIANGNQWYKGGVALNGQNGQTLSVSNFASGMGSGNYSVSNNGCSSQNVNVNFKPYGNAQGGDNVTPISYCRGKNGVLKQTDYSFLSNNIQYSWTVNGISQNCTSTSNTCNVFFPDNYSSSTASITATVVTDGCSDSHTYTVQVGPNGVFNSFNQCFSQPTLFDINANTAYTEEWDFGSNANPRYLTSTVNGTSHDNRYITFSSSGTQSVRHFSSSTYSNYPVCWEELILVNVNPNCRVSSVNNDTLNNKLIIFPNPAHGLVTINAENVIKSVEILSSFSSIYKVINRNGKKSISINISAFRPGIYQCIVSTEKGKEFGNIVVK